MTDRIVNELVTFVCPACGCSVRGLRRNWTRIVPECTCAEEGQRQSMLQVWPAPSPWISVEGMPDDAGQCLVEASTSYGPPPSVFTAWRREGRWAWASSAAFWYATPTRYMPIPSTEEVADAATNDNDAG